MSRIFVLILLIWLKLIKVTPAASTDTAANEPNIRVSLVLIFRLLNIIAIGLVKGVLGFGFRLTKLQKVKIELNYKNQG
jgi:hypothetical protein